MSSITAAASAFANTLYFSMNPGVSGSGIDLWLMSVDFGETESFGRTTSNYGIHWSGNVQNERVYYNIKYNTTYYYRGKIKNPDGSYDYDTVKTITTPAATALYSPIGDTPYISEGWGGTYCVLPDGSFVTDHEGNRINFSKMSVYPFGCTLSPSYYGCTEYLGGKYDGRLFKYDFSSFTRAFYGIRVHILYRKTYQFSSLSMSLRKPSTRAFSTEIAFGTGAPVGSASVLHSETYETNPFTGKAWTIEDLADLQVYVYIKNTEGGSVNVGIHYVGIELMGATFVLGKPGYLWVEGETLRYTDAEGIVRILTGTPLIDYLTSLEEE